MTVLQKIYIDPSDFAGVINNVISATESVSDSLTAYAGGGQTNGTALTAYINRVTTVATAADSVKLPAATPGADVVVINAAASNSMNVFPATGEFINAGSANAAFAVAAGKTAHLVSPVAGRWYAILSA
jgi:hypothetical protein